jgi:hypothetical protein
MQNQKLHIETAADQSGQEHAKVMLGPVYSADFLNVKHARVWHDASDQVRIRV